MDELVNNIFNYLREKEWPFLAKTATVILLLFLPGFSLIFLGFRSFVQSQPTSYTFLVSIIISFFIVSFLFLFFCMSSPSIIRICLNDKIFMYVRNKRFKYSKNDYEEKYILGLLNLNENLQNIKSSANQNVLSKEKMREEKERIIVKKEMSFLKFMDLSEISQIASLKERFIVISTLVTASIVVFCSSLWLQIFFSYLIYDPNKNKVLNELLPGNIKISLLYFCLYLVSLSAVFLFIDLLEMLSIRKASKILKYKKNQNTFKIILSVFFPILFVAFFVKVTLLSM